jgi:antitoxin CcdA
MSKYRVEETRAEYPANVTKKPLNLSVNAALLEDAKASGINLSRFLEEHLREALFAQRKKRWEEENKGFIESYNAYIDKYGTSHSRYQAGKREQTEKPATSGTTKSRKAA